MKLFLKTIIISFIILFIFLPSIILATNGTGGSGQSDPVSLPNPLTTDGKAGPTIPELIGKVIKAVLGIVGSLALVMFIYGGITWMTSAGNAEKVQKGKDILVWAAIGLIIIFTSYVLVRFVLKEGLGVIT